jgi:toxin FitB
VSFLVDTNVISELRKGSRCNRAVAAWWDGVDSEDIYLSVLTVGEIRQGVERIRRRDAASAAILERWLARLVRDHANRIVPIDLDIAARWGSMNVPDPLPVIDGLLAATALERGLTLATRNEADVARTGVSLINPWKT